MTLRQYYDICAYLDRITLGTRWEGRLYAVGGCCRDSVMGREPNDVDIAVELPDGGVRFARWLDENRFTTRRPVIFPVYGTARLTLREFPLDEIELVQTRRGKYDGNDPETPEAVHGSVADDAARRDLTINALYYDIRRRELLDPTGMGLEDISRQILRTPMEPELTFDDDPIRILRVIRFAATLGWEIAPGVWNAMQKNFRSLDRIKIERIRAEIEKAIVSPRPRMALEMLRNAGVLKLIVPELADTFTRRLPGDSETTVWEHTLRIVEAAPPSPVTRTAALLFHLAVPGEREADSRPDTRLLAAVLKRFKYTPSYIDSVLFPVRHLHDISRLGTDVRRIPAGALRRLKRKCGGRTRLNRLLAFAAAYRTATPGTPVPDIEKLRPRLLAMK